MGFGGGGIDVLRPVVAPDQRSHQVGRLGAGETAVRRVAVPGHGLGHGEFLGCLGAPAFSLNSLGWSYGNYTWHTNRDTYDKIVFDDVRSNAILTAIMAYAAAEDGPKTSRERIVLPANQRTGQPGTWPATRSPTRKGGMD